MTAKIHVRVARLPHAPALAHPVAVAGQYFDTSRPGDSFSEKGSEMATS
jgi:hypothetical protein